MRPIPPFRIFWVSLALFILMVAADAQITIQGEPEASKPAKAAPAANDHPSQINLEFDMTPKEAEHLLASVDEVLAFDSKVTGLPIRTRVERRITNRDELKQLAAKRMQDRDVTETIQRSSAVLKKFGFIPRDFDLPQFSVESTVSQLAGYYDPRVKTMYLLNWLPAASQLPVMAHELDHALQDQSFDLQNWLKTDDPKANGPTGGDPSEQRAARRAVAEGQATAVMLEYSLAPQGRSIAQLPPISPDLMESFIERYSNLQTTQSAPLMLREELTFPYVYGLAFVQQVLIKDGKQEAYAGIFKRPPQSTRQIMEPGVYLAHEELPPLPLPPLENELGTQYQKVENGSIGEFDCMLFMKQYGEAEHAKEISRGWRGDYFYAAKRAGAEPSGPQPPTQSLQPKDVFLLFVSRWSSPSSAHDFATFYGKTVSQRYSHAEMVGASPSPAAASWNTGEGPVKVYVEGSLVIVTETFDPDTSALLRAAVLKADGSSAAAITH